jgi:hypothetical protein
MRDRLSRWELSILVALCLVGALRVFVFAAAFPFFNNVDEQSHVDLVLKYARGYVPGGELDPFDTETGLLIATYGTYEYRKPADQPPGAPEPLFEQSTEEIERVHANVEGRLMPRNHEAHSPPVYYAVAAVWYRLGGLLGLDGGARLYWLRFLNVVWMAALVAAAWAFVREAFPDRLDLRLGVAALAAFFPQDAFYAVNCDALSAPLAALSLLWLMRWWRSESPGHLSSAGLGLFVATTFLVKFTNIALVLIFGVVLLVRAVRGLRAPGARSVLVPVAVAALAAGLPVACFFLRNELVLGDLTGQRAKVEQLGWWKRAPEAYLEHPIFTFSGLHHFWRGLAGPWWRGEFVWNGRHVTELWLDRFYLWSSTASLALAAIAPLLRRREGNVRPARGFNVCWAYVGLSLLTLAALSIAFEYGNSRYPSSRSPFFVSGRLLLGMLVPFLVLYLDGAGLILRRVSQRYGVLVFAGLLCVLVTIVEVTITADVFASRFNWYHLP